MSEQALQDSWWLFTRARGTGLLLRLAVFVGALLALACTRLAASSTPFLIEAIVVLCALWCVVSPDSHVGIVMALFIALDWLVAVEDTTSPWVLGVAVSLLVVHAAMAAASISAPAAVWSRAMRVRWLRRAGRLAAASAVVYVAVVLVHQYEVAPTASLVTAALVVLAVGGLWVADLTVERRGTRRPDRPTQP